MSIPLWIYETWDPRLEKRLRLRKGETGHDPPGMTVGVVAAGALGKCHMGSTFERKLMTKAPRILSLHYLQ